MDIGNLNGKQKLIRTSSFQLLRRVPQRLFHIMPDLARKFDGYSARFLTKKDGKGIVQALKKAVLPRLPCHAHARLLYLFDATQAEELPLQRRFIHRARVHIDRAQPHIQAPRVNFSPDLRPEPVARAENAHAPALFHGIAPGEKDFWPYPVALRGHALIKTGLKLLLKRAAAGHPRAFCPRAHGPGLQEFVARGEKLLQGKHEYEPVRKIEFRERRKPVFKYPEVPALHLVKLKARLGKGGSVFIKLTPTNTQSCPERVHLLMPVFPYACTMRLSSRKKRPFCASSPTSSSRFPFHNALFCIRHGTVPFFALRVRARPGAKPRLRAHPSPPRPHRCGLWQNFVFAKGRKRDEIFPKNNAAKILHALIFARERCFKKRYGSEWLKTLN